MQHDFVATFLQEADDLLNEIEGIALNLVAGALPDDNINHLFRAFHTIKGSAGMFGLDAVAGFTHHLESVLDLVRSGNVPVSEELIGTILAAKDHIKVLLQADDGGLATPDDFTAELVGKIDALMRRDRSLVTTSAVGEPQSTASAESVEKAWEIHFRPDPNLIATGGNPALLFKDLQRLGECTVVADTGSVPPLDEISPELCYLYWTITLRTTADLNAIRDVFLFVEEGSDLDIRPVAHPTLPRDMTAVPAVQQSPRRPATEPINGAARTAKPTASEGTVRVPADRLDRLVNLVGELVMNQSRLQQAATQAGSSHIAAPVEAMDRLIAELRDNVLGIRMMPIGTIFGRFRRLVHDLSAELGKEIDLLTEGEETELDKSVLDRIGEPLVHILRNSIDHGIEAPDARLRKGKPQRGAIRLTAVHTGADVVVTVEDDGRGLDPEQIRAKAVEKGLIPQDAALTESEIFNLILLPGFSTASQITDVSGRGVGMDVVKKHIDALHGSLAVASEHGRSFAVSLTLPLTVAIIDGLVLESAGDQFIIPMSAITESVELHREQRLRNNGRNVIAVRGDLVPYIDVRKLFTVGGEPPILERIVIVRHGTQRVGLVVDRVLGTHQTVLQSLGRFLRGVDVVSGATIMGDGRVALILDVGAVVRLANESSQHAVVNSLDSKPTIEPTAREFARVQ